MGWSFNGVVNLHMYMSPVSVPRQLYLPVGVNQFPLEIEPLLRQLRQIVRHEYGIRHVTLQIEQSLEGCAEENHHVGHLISRSHAET